MSDTINKSDSGKCFQIILNNFSEFAEDDYVYKYNRTQQRKKQKRGKYWKN